MSRIFKKKSEFSKTIVILDISLFIIYIIINIIMQWNKGFTMPMDINTGVFAFLTGELGILSFIKRCKLKAETTQNSVQTISADQAQLLLLQKQQLQNNNTQQGAAG